MADENKEALRRAVQELGVYVGEVGEHQFVGRLLQLAANGGDVNDPSLTVEALEALQKSGAAPGSDLEDLISSIIGLTDGGTYLHQFVNKTSEFVTGDAPGADASGVERANEDLVEKIIGVEDRLWTVTGKETFAPGKEFCCTKTINEIIRDPSINSQWENPSKEVPNIGVVQFHNAALNFANRSTGIIGVFLNMLPTIEISKCQPYVDLKVITKTPPTNAYLEADGNTMGERIGDGISILRFLLGQSDVKSVGSAFLNARPIGIEMPKTIRRDSDGDTVYENGQPVYDTLPSTVAGMEIFTSPQTLVNANEPHYDVGPNIVDGTPNSPAHRHVSVIDRFRPFMTFKSFDVDIAPARGMISTKAANATFTLHDRSRLAEVSQLVTPEGLDDVEIVVEYGWSHPEGSYSRNSFATMLNSMRTKEKFQVVNSSLSFNEVGEVDISLKLVGKGSRDLSFRMVTDDEVPQAYDELKKMFKEIKKLKRAIRSDLQENEEMVGEQILGKANSVSAIRTLEKKDFDELKKVLNDILKDPKSSQQYTDLANGLNKAITTMKSMENKISRAFRKKMSRLKTSPDPFAKACPSAGIFMVNGRIVSQQYRVYSDAQIAAKTDPIKNDASARAQYEEDAYSQAMQAIKDQGSAIPSSEAPDALKASSRTQGEHATVYQATSINDDQTYRGDQGAQTWNSMQIKFKSPPSKYTALSPDAQRYLNLRDLIPAGKTTDWADAQVMAQQRLLTVNNMDVVTIYSPDAKMRETIRNLAVRYYYVSPESLVTKWFQENQWEGESDPSTGIGNQQSKWTEGANSRAAAIDAQMRSAMFRYKYVSFARVALEFIARPLASTGMFNEVQLMFYPMNAYASMAKDDDVGSFPICYRYFEKHLREKLKKSPNMTVAGFVGFMNQYFFGNISSHIYGFKSLYTRDKETGAAQLRKKYKDNKKNKRRLPNEKKRIFQKAYGPGGEHKFVKPQIQMFMEAVPGNGSENGGESSTILRIHFFDNACTSFSGFADMWESLRGGVCSIINSKSVSAYSPKTSKPSDAPQASTRSGHDKQWNQQLALLQSMDILEAIDASGNVVPLDKHFEEYDTASGTTASEEEINDALEAQGVSYVRVKGGPNGLRYLYHRNMPSIKYGSNYSAVLKANLSTTQDNRMATIHMQRQNKNQADGAAGSDDGLPLRTFPATLNVETYGCPFINFGQQYFIDFQTGTTVDNIYGVNGVSHKFGQGSYTTTIKFVPISKYGTYQSITSNLSKLSHEIQALASSAD